MTVNIRQEKHFHNNETKRAQDTEFMHGIDGTVPSTNINHKSEGLYRRIFEEMYDSVLLIKDTRFIDCNIAAITLLGFSSQSELLAHFNSHDICTPRQLDGRSGEHSFAWMMSIALQEGFHRFECTYARVDGTTIPVEVTLTPIRLAGDVITIALWRDITERKLAEQAFLDSESRWKFAIEGSGDGVWDWDIQTAEAKYSRRWKEMMGYAEKDVMPSNEEWTDHIHPDDKAFVTEAMRDYLEGRTANYVVEYRLKCKNGSYKWILSRGMAVSRDVKGNPLRIIGTHTDITERKRAELELEESNRKLSALSITDGLTGIPNRRRFDEVLAHEYARHTRSGTELSLIMLDIDFFKSFNDCYGHVSGDDCLRQVAQVMVNNISRPADLVARYGGEEFACILPDTDSNGAFVIAEKIRWAIIACAIPHKKSQIADCVTASLGVITVRCTANESIEEIVARADEVLYHAKSRGRNRVELCPPGTDASSPEEKSCDSGLKYAPHRRRSATSHQTVTSVHPETSTL